jgi:hypothetical protein
VTERTRIASNDECRGKLRVAIPLAGPHPSIY